MEELTYPVPTLNALQQLPYLKRVLKFVFMTLPDNSAYQLNKPT
jgi:hypothetical protein